MTSSTTEDGGPDLNSIKLPIRTLAKPSSRPKSRMSATSCKIDRRIVVTGGAGYIGSHLVRMLASLGRRVIVIDNGLHAERSLRNELSNGLCRLVSADIRDIPRTEAAYRGCSTVFHLAAAAVGSSSDSNRNSTFSINVTGTDVVASLAARSGVNRFFFASTCSVYGKQSGFLNEESQALPADLYAASKVEAEIRLRKFLNEMEIGVLRFATAFGVSRKMRNELVVNAMTRDAKIHRRITVRAPQNWRPIIHCGDIADACVSAINWPLSKNDLNVVNVGATKNNFQIIDLGRHVQSHFPLSELHILNSASDPRSYHVDFAKIKSLSDWTPRITLDAGIVEIAHNLSF